MVGLALALVFCSKVMKCAIRSSLATLFTLTMLGFSGNIAAVVIPLTLTCDDVAMICSYEGEATFSGSEAFVEGIFENMQHVETKADAMLGNLLKFTASADTTRTIAPLDFTFLMNELGENVRSLVTFAGGETMLGPDGMFSSFVASPGIFNPATIPTGLVFHGLHWPFAFEGAGTLQVSGDFENVQRGVWGVPIPTTFALFGLGLAGLGFVRRKNS